MGPRTCRRARVTSRHEQGDLLHRDDRRRVHRRRRQLPAVALRRGRPRGRRGRVGRLHRPHRRPRAGAHDLRVGARPRGPAGAPGAMARVLRRPAELGVQPPRPAAAARVRHPLRAGRRHRARRGDPGVGRRPRRVGGRRRRPGRPVRRRRPARRDRGLGDAGVPRSRRTPAPPPAHVRARLAARGQPPRAARAAVPSTYAGGPSRQADPLGGVGLTTRLVGWRDEEASAVDRRRGRLRAGHEGRSRALRPDPRRRPEGAQRPPRAGEGQAGRRRGP